MPLDPIPRNVEQVRQREPIEQPAGEEARSAIARKDATARVVMTAIARIGDEVSPEPAAAPPADEHGAGVAGRAPTLDGA